MRKMLAYHDELWKKLDQIEQHVLENKYEIQDLRFELKKMMIQEKNENQDDTRIGFRV